MDSKISVFLATKISSYGTKSFLAHIHGLYAKYKTFYLHLLKEWDEKESKLMNLSLQMCQYA